MTSIGITLGFIMLMLVILFKGGTQEVRFFLDISSIFVVIGGLAASLLINFKMKQIKLTGAVLKEAFHQNDYRLKDHIHLTESYLIKSEQCYTTGFVSP